MRKFIFSLFLLSITSIVYAWEIVPFDEKTYQSIRSEYGADTETRFRNLQAVLMKEKELTRSEQLIAINTFFNQVEWRSDLSHWGKKDYWQTPLETMMSFTGDCEDIAIAKYTALRMLGIADERLVLVYGLITRKPQYINTPHMVLAYYPSHAADPLILDSIDKKIKNARTRSDLISVYEFNTSTLWLTDHHLHKLGKDKSVANFSLENELKQRLTKNRHHLIKLSGGKPLYPFDLNTL